MLDDLMIDSVTLSVMAELGVISNGRQFYFTSELLEHDIIDSETYIKAGGFCLRVGDNRYSNYFSTLAELTVSLNPFPHDNLLGCKQFHKEMQNILTITQHHAGEFEDHLLVCNQSNVFKTLFRSGCIDLIATD